MKALLPDPLPVWSGPLHILMARKRSVMNGATGSTAAGGRFAKNRSAERGDCLAGSKPSGRALPCGNRAWRYFCLHDVKRALSFSKFYLGAIYDAV